MSGDVFKTTYSKAYIWHKTQPMIQPFRPITNFVGLNDAEHFLPPPKKNEKVKWGPDSADIIKQMYQDRLRSSYQISYCKYDTETSSTASQAKRESKQEQRHKKIGEENHLIHLLTQMYRTPQKKLMAPLGTSRRLENYSKGKNVEEPLERDKIPIPNLPPQFVWMQVNGGSKMRNLLNYAIKAFKDERIIVWSGSAAGMGKAISCVEIMKRRNKQVHQVTKICYRKVEEFWEPQLEDLDPLVVVREVPTIHILLSKDALNTAEPGYQAPGSFDTFWRNSQEASANQHRRTGPPNWKTKTPRISSDQFAAMGLRSNQKRPKNVGGDRTNLKSSSSKGLSDSNSQDRK